MKETKICPFCGEEILTVAKKCKHCGEWLEPQVASTSDNYNSPLEMYKSIDYTKMLPVTSILFGLNLWVGIYPLFFLLFGTFGGELYYEMPAFCFNAIRLILPLIALVIVISVVRYGLLKSNYLTSSLQTTKILRNWLALEIGLATWPAIVVIGWALASLSIFSEGGYLIYFLIFWCLLIVGAIVLWQKLKSTGDEVSSNRITKIFTLCTLIMTTFSIILIMIHFEYNFVPWNNYWY